MSKPKPPSCPRCGNNRKSTYRGPGDYLCSEHGLYDDDPDEGGTHSDRNPAARLERADRRREGRRR